MEARSANVNVLSYLVCYEQNKNHNRQDESLIDVKLDFEKYGSKISCNTHYRLMKKDIDTGESVFMLHVKYLDGQIPNTF